MRTFLPALGAVLAASGVAWACSSDRPDAVTTSDGGTGGTAESALGDTSCPDGGAPAKGAPCIGDLTCVYAPPANVCSTNTGAQCTNGKWVVAGGDSPPVAALLCGELPPVNGSSCGVCYQGSACSYECDAGAAFSGTAKCNAEGIWEVQTGAACTLCAPGCTERELCCSQPVLDAGAGDGGAQTEYRCVDAAPLGYCPAVP